MIYRAQNIVPVVFLYPVSESYTDGKLNVDRYEWQNDNSLTNIVVDSSGGGGECVAFDILQLTAVGCVGDRPFMCEYSKRELLIQKMVFYNRNIYVYIQFNPKHQNIFIATGIVISVRVIREILCFQFQQFPLWDHLLKQ